MSRIRTVKPEFWVNEELSTLDAHTRLLAIGILNIADDEGWFRAHTSLILAAVFPFETQLDATKMLADLADINYITLMTGTDGKSYGLINNFLKHQRISKPQPSKINDLCMVDDNSRNAQGDVTERLRNGCGTVAERLRWEEEEEEEEEQGKGTGNREGEREEDKPAQEGKIVSTKLAGDEVHHREEPLSSMDINFPTTGKGRFVVSQKDINDWQGLHPLIDVAQECRNMVGWLSDNKNKQRPRNQMRKFCSGWLARQSSDAGKRMVQSSSSSRTAKNIQAAQEALRGN